MMNIKQKYHSTFQKQIHLTNILYCVDHNIRDDGYSLIFQGGCALFLMRFVCLAVRMIAQNLLSPFP